MIRTLTHGALPLTLVIAAGCAEVTRPPVLMDAREALGTERTRQLAATRPKLVRDARRDTQAGEVAIADGDTERAELYGQLARLRLETAADLDARDEIEVRIKAMDRAVGEQTRLADSMGREAAALQRFTDAEQRFAALNDEVARERDSAQSAEAQARKRLVEARNAQATAVGAGAPSAAPAAYGEGQALLEAGLQALDAGLPIEARGAADRAINRFEAAVAESARSGDAQAVASERSARDAAARAEAEQAARLALDEAEAARAGALGAGFDRRDPAAFARASYVLEVGRARVDDGRFAEARERALEASAIFKAAGQTDPARQAIEDAEDARTAALETAEPSALTRPDALLERARRAAAEGQRERAVSLAGQARSGYQSAPARRAAAGPMPTGWPGFGPAPMYFAQQPMGPQGAAPADDTMRREAERVVVAARTRRAEAFAQELDVVCGPRFREFEALVELADARLDDGALVDAISLAVKAEERLARCPAAGNTPGAGAPRPPASPAKAKATTPAVRAAKVAPAPADKTEIEARRGARTALADAQRLVARGRARRGDAAALDAAEKLVSDARRWAEEGRWTEAAALAVEARALAEGALTARIEPAAPAQKLGVEKAAVVAATPPMCPAQLARLGGVEVAQSRAAVQLRGAEDETRFKRAATALLTARRFADDGRCGPADALIADAEVVFGAIQAGPARPAAGAASAAPVSPTPATAALVSPTAPIPPAAAQVDARCAALQPGLRDGRIAQGAALGTLTNEAGRRRYRQTVGELDRAELLAGEGRCAESELAARMARAELDRLASEKPAPKAATADRAAPATPAAGTPSPPVDPAQLADARASLARAEVAAARVGHARGSAVHRTGARLLGEGRRLLATGRVLEAAQVADQATYAFESIPDAPAKAASTEKATPPTPEDVTDWRPAYGTVVQTLELRDRARKAARTDAHAISLARGESALSQARDAWTAQDYALVRRRGAVAAEAFREVLADGAPATPAAAPGEGDAARAASERVAAERAALESERLALASDRAEVTEAGARIESAQSAAQAAEAARQDADVATRAAADADALANRTQAESAITAAEGRARDGAAPDDARRASVAWARGDEALAAARRAVADGAFAVARGQAEQALGHFDTALAAPQPFVMPDDSRHVVRIDDQLHLDPRPVFTSGSEAPESDSQVSLDALARALLANIDRPWTLRVVGYSDDRGRASRNVELSGRRAESVRRALIARGVPAVRVSAEGRGSAQPAHSNATPGGRALNRRVEVLLDRGPGVM